MSQHWRASHLAIPVQVDPIEAARAQQENIRSHNSLARSGAVNIDRHNLAYRTEAEDPNKVASFLELGMQVDYHINRHLQGRPYLVLQGGDTYYHTPVDVALRYEIPLPERFRPITERQPPDPRDFVDRKVSFPTTKEVNGHHPRGQYNRGGFP